MDNLFYVLRIILWIFVSILVMSKIRKTEIVRKKLLSFVIIFLCLILISITGMSPIENIFIQFKTPENVFHYVNSGKIDDIIYGENSCMVIYSDSDSTGSHFIVSKTEKGYRIPGYFETKHVLHKFDKSGCFDIYNAAGTDDYYIVGTFISKNDDINIIDSSNEPIKKIMIDMDDSDIKNVLIYSRAKNYEDGYYLLVNGEKIVIRE